MMGIGLLTGCAHLFKPPQENSGARQILQRLAENNSGLTQYKALANIRIESDGQTISGRIAMAAVVPDKLRVEWLNTMGQPLTSMSADGRTITVFSRIEQVVHRFRQSRTALEPLTHIPISVEDLQTIVVGRFPLPADAAAQLKAVHNDMDTVVLKNRWHNVLATMQVDQTNSRVSSMTVFNAQGELQYEIQWLRWRQEDEYLIPAKIIFESKSRQRLILTMDRFWPNANVPLSTFELDIPKSES